MGSWSIVKAGGKPALCSRGLRTSSRCEYREDYHKLGLSESASVDEIRAAYFRKAKEHHPDSRPAGSQDGEALKFIELTEAYKRLTYESKNTAQGLHNIDRTDPRNDPRQMEYWYTRRRQRTQEEVKAEEEASRRQTMKERVLVRKILLAVMVGIFFGTIFPAFFVGQDDFVDGCLCDRCLLRRINSNPSTKYLLRNTRAAVTVED